MSDFHKMVITVMKKTFPKAKPRIIQYRCYKNFNLDDFRIELRARLEKEVVIKYAKFEEIFLEVLKRRFSELITNLI